MKSECSGAEKSAAYQKRYAEPDGLNFMLGPGGQAAIVTKQMPAIESGAPQTPTLQQISDPERTPTVTPLLPTTLPGNSGATILQDAETSGLSSTLMSSMIQLSPGIPSNSIPVAVSSPLSDSSPFASLSSSTPALATIPSNTDGALETSGPMAESSQQAIVPTTVSSEAVNVKPPIYAGIILGTIAGIAFLTALIAWWIRMRAYAKRRRLYQNAGVPWARSEGSDGGLEEAGDATLSHSDLDSIGLDGGEDLAQAQAWEPRGDRDVGEPRRSESYSNTSGGSSRLFGSYACDPYAPQATHANQYQHSHNLPLNQLFQNMPYPHPRSLPSLQSVDSNVSGSVDDQSSGRNLGPLRVANLMPGDRSGATSRATTALGMNNRIYSLGTDEIESLTRTKSGTSRGTWDSRSIFAHSWTSLPTRREDNRDSEKHGDLIAGPESDGWTASLKSIFTAVASNLSIRNGITSKEDTLTPIPHKRSIRRSVRGINDNYYGGNDAMYPESSTVQGTGYEAKTDDVGEATEMRQPGLSSKTSKLNKAGQLGRDLAPPSWRNFEHCASQEYLSRASSMYSTISASPSVNSQPGQEPAISKTALSQSSIVSLGSIHRHGTRKSGQEMSTRPSAITRVSSTGCSISSSQLVDEGVIQSALIDRRHRARRDEKWVEQQRE
ncbi:hypothetical protein AX17_003041 [Amanita inopinata Kibby_2008]|nr:hypothetical protein AX17_003041 [Amanita inopinata Kibby_2008]